MASNTITKVIPKILAQGLMALRQNSITPRLVANLTSDVAGKKGSTIDVPIPSAILATDVTPAATAPVAGALNPDTVPVVLDKWKEAAFDLSDSEFEQVMDGFVPLAITEAAKSLANAVDASILALYTKFFGYHGTAGTTPFGTPGIGDATGIRKVLNNNAAPMEPRHIILNPDAEAAALGLEPLANMNFTGSVSAMRDGNLERRLGMSWWMNQNIPTHTAGTASGATTDSAGYAIGVTTVTLASAGTGSILIGDIITFAGHAQTYAVTSGDASVAGGGTISFYPPLKVALAASPIAITLKASHVANLAFHRDAFAFATRPLLTVPVDPERMGQQIDPVSGLALRVELVREFKRTRWSFDILWGVAVARPELGARLAG